MLTWFAAAAAVSTAVVGGRWWRRRADYLGRRRPFPWISVVLLSTLSIGAAAPAVIREREESRLGRAASTLIGIRVIVHCQTLGGAFIDAGSELGYVRYGSNGRMEHATLIKRDQCRDLSAYLRSDKQHPTDAEVEAVHVLTHESMHMSGVTGEAQAECAAMQRDATLARLLGASAADASRLAERYWRTDYAFMPADYTSSDCRPGGALDEHRTNAPWQSPAGR